LIQINCDWGNEILNWMTCFEGLGYLQDLGDEGGMCTVGAGSGTEARVSCSQGCGIYLGNLVRTNNDQSLNGDQANTISVWQADPELSVNCGDIARDIGEIYEACASPSGQRFHGSKTFEGSHFIGLGHDEC
jgi:hypothetical protein